MVFKSSYKKDMLIDLREYRDRSFQGATNNIYKHLLRPSTWKTVTNEWVNSHVYSISGDLQATQRVS
jgi:hypothetical protein